MNAQGADQAERGSGTVPAHPDRPSPRNENPPAPTPHPARSSPPPIAVITGPTAVGKTEIGVLVAEALGTEIVNADSMQVYREMHAGTAKPTPEERARVPHHLVEVASVRDVFTVADFKELAITSCTG